MLALLRGGWGFGNALFTTTPFLMGAGVVGLGSVCLLIKGNIIRTNLSTPTTHHTD